MPEWSIEKQINIMLILIKIEYDNFMTLLLYIPDWCIFTDNLFVLLKNVCFGK